MTHTPLTSLVVMPRQQLGVLEPLLYSFSAHLASVDAASSTTRVDVSKREQVDGREHWAARQVRRRGQQAGVIGENHGFGATLADLVDDEWESIIGVDPTGCVYSLRAIADGGRHCKHGFLFMEW